VSGATKKNFGRIIHLESIHGVGQAALKRLGLAEIFLGSAAALIHGPGGTK